MINYINIIYIPVFIDIAKCKDDGNYAIGEGGG
jgi:hypothetical protein